MKVPARNRAPTLSCPPEKGLGVTAPLGARCCFSQAPAGSTGRGEIEPQKTGFTSRRVAAIQVEWGVRRCF